ncbi:hypothetical protein UA45_18975, partial [Morganella morganii]
MAAIMTGIYIHQVPAAVSLGAFGYKAAMEAEQEPELTGDSGEDVRPAAGKGVITSVPAPSVAPLVPLTGDPVASETEIIRQRSIQNNLPKSQPAATGAVTAAAAGQNNPPGGLTLQDAVIKSLDWDAGLSGLVNQYRAQLEAVYQKETEYYPQPGLGVSRTLNNSDKGYVTTASVSQLLYSFGRVSSQIDSLTARSDQSLLRVLLMPMKWRKKPRCCISISNVTRTISCWRKSSWCRCSILPIWPVSGLPPVRLPVEAVY